jgi:hypothetical protein
VDSREEGWRNAVGTLIIRLRAGGRRSRRRCPALLLLDFIKNELNVGAMGKVLEGFHVPEMTKELLSHCVAGFLDSGTWLLSIQLEESFAGTSAKIPRKTKVVNEKKDPLHVMELLVVESLPVLLLLIYLVIMSLTGHIELDVTEHDEHKLVCNREAPTHAKLIVSKPKRPISCPCKEA